jgi:Anp1
MKAICTPVRDFVLAGFTYDLAQLLRVERDVVFTISHGTYISNQRNLLAKTAMAHGASHVLFIDSDMRFPPDTLQQLLRRGLDIVGANCSQRMKKEFTARARGCFISSVGKTGIEKVDTLGMGVTLIKREVFEKLPEPWFFMQSDGTKDIGEDVNFCLLAGKHGIKIHIDHDLSQQVRHAGIVEFGMDGF